MFTHGMKHDAEGAFLDKDNALERYSSSSTTA